MFPRWPNPEFFVEPQRFPAESQWLQPACPGQGSAKEKGGSSQKSAPKKTLTCNKSFPKDLWSQLSDFFPTYSQINFFCNLPWVTNLHELITLNFYTMGCKQVWPGCFAALKDFQTAPKAGNLQQKVVLSLMMSYARPACARPPPSC